MAVQRGIVLGQSQVQKEVIIKNLPDTILGHRTLLVPAPFDGQTALHKLFPGKWYDLSSQGYPNRFSSWSCRGCKTVIYQDVNGVEDPVPFPYKEGVATRLLNVLSFADSSGKQYKLLCFSHSIYDESGIPAGRFSGGLLGMAKFNQTDSGWRLQAFQPAIAAYGAFSQAPAPELLQIGEDQYAFMVKHVNGGAASAFTQDDYLIAGIGGAYRQVLAAYGVSRTNTEDNECTWTSTYTSAGGDKKKYFRDIVIISKGRYLTADKEGLPEELRGKVSQTVQGRFTITHVFEYSVKQGYRERLPALVVVESK